MRDPGPEVWDIDQVAAYMGVQPGSARGTLSRLGVTAAEYRRSGGRVRAYYSADQVRAAHRRRPGRGARTDLNP
ncbi:hypothetical protein [Streptomyces cacaoi]|uniref:hypothetical protein n=1 Tax=Streptomyces cacaoi TaxID=1898 RepID=UPI00262B50A5|nr:hypothetical protein [Streptomyces cacaoi]